LDDESSDEEDMNKIFKGLSRDQVAKVNELIKVVNEKDELLEKQENKILTHELKVCNSLISSPKCTNDDPDAQIEKLNV
jgi:hypothetical protein